MSTRPTTPAEFKREAVARFKRVNPDARKVKFAWEFARPVTWPTGLTGWSGVAWVTAEGYRPKTVVATWDTAAGWTVR